MQNDTPFPEQFKAVIRTEFPELQPAVVKGVSPAHICRLANEAKEGHESSDMAGTVYAC
jgi:hypothetical protein